MSKDLSVSVLLDFYSELLTQKQRDTMDLYYNSDYSLAEIAQHLDISRQGVRDFIKRGEKQLYEFEDKLKLAELYNAIAKNTENIESILNSINQDNISKKVSDIKDELENIKKLL